MEDVVMSGFGEGWWRKRGVEVAKSGCSAVRRPVVDLLSTGRQVYRGRSERGRERGKRGLKI
jgi:hypothetical protein